MKIAVLTDRKLQIQLNPYPNSITFFKELEKATLKVKVTHKRLVTAKTILTPGLDVPP